MKNILQVSLPLGETPHPGDRRDRVGSSNEQRNIEPEGPGLPTEHGFRCHSLAPKIPDPATDCLVAWSLVDLVATCWGPKC